MKKIIQIVLLALIVKSNIALAYETKDENDRYCYIGIQAGLSEPIQKSFKHKDSGTNIRLKQSHLYSGRFGYSFYPNMMVELSFTHQPKYRLSYRLPEVDVPKLGTSIPTTPGTTRVESNVSMLNLIYEMDKLSFLEIKPYVLFGAGLAKISIKPTTSYWKNPPSLVAFLMGSNNVPFFKIKKDTQDCFAWQAGLGFSKDISDNFSVDFGAKLQVVNDIKIKYQKINLLTKEFEDQSPIKKTIGVGEFTVGIKYKLSM